MSPPATETESQEQQPPWIAFDRARHETWPPDSPRPALALIQPSDKSANPHEITRSCCLLRRHFAKPGPFTLLRWRRLNVR